jgi:hypothetical protein
LTGSERLAEEGYNECKLPKFALITLPDTNRR